MSLFHSDTCQVPLSSRYIVLLLMKTPQHIFTHAEFRWFHVDMIVISIMAMAVGWRDAGEMTAPAKEGTGMTEVFIHLQMEMRNPS